MPLSEEQIRNFRGYVIGNVTIQEDCKFGVFLKTDAGEELLHVANSYEEALGWIENPTRKN